MTEISVDALEKAGWVKTNDEIGMYPMEKEIENRNFLNTTPEDTSIKLAVHRMYNSDQFAVLFPNGAMLNFNPESMEDLEAFERMLYFYDCEY